MTEARISLDQWAGQEPAGTAAKDRELVRAFQREWSQGHESNPFLFPMDLAPAAWKDQFDWFVKIDTFLPAKSEPVVETTPRPEISADKIEEDLKAGTVILEAEARPSGLDDLETLVVDRMPFVPIKPSLESDAKTITGDTDASQEGAGLDDLGTLILESKETVKKPLSTETPSEQLRLQKVEPEELEIELNGLVIETESSEQRKAPVGSGGSDEGKNY